MTSELSPRREPPDRAEVAFRPPVVLGLSLAAGFLGRWITPLTFLPEGASAVLGPAVIGVAAALFGWAGYTMHAGNASIPTYEPTDVIVANGPYRLSRNPIYLAMVLILCGVGVWVNSLWFLGGAGVSAVLLTRGVIFREEQYLERKFGPEYLSYKARVRRWL